MNIDITRDHCEWRFTGNDRTYATSTMIFPNGTVARWNQNETEFAGAMARECGKQLGYGEPSDD